MNGTEMVREFLALDRRFSFHVLRCKVNVDRTAYFIDERFAENITEWSAVPGVAGKEDEKEKEKTRHISCQQNIKVRKNSRG